MRVERPRPRERPVAPDVTEQLVLREDALRLGGERREQLELLAGQMNRLTADGDDAGGQVDHKAADLEPLLRRRRDAAQHGADPRHQLVVDDGRWR